MHLRSLALVFVLLLSLVPAPHAAADSPQPTDDPGASTWTSPALVASGPYTWPSADARHLHLVALKDDPVAPPEGKPVVAFARAGDVWSAPSTVASNGANQTESGMVWLPQHTHPVVSADGRGLAYLGATGQTAPSPAFGIYAVARLSAGWGSPAMLTGSLANAFYITALSGDGATVAYSSYSVWDTPQLYVASRTGGFWGPGAVISHPTYGGAYPSLSEDGRRVVYVANSHLWYAERLGEVWSPARDLTPGLGLEEAVEDPTLSADGLAASYWVVKLVPEGSALVRTAQDLYMVRRQGTGWGAPQRVTAQPVLPNSLVDAPAALNRTGMRVAYAIPITDTDVVVGSYIVASDWVAWQWTAPQAVAGRQPHVYDAYPDLSSDGRSLIYAGNRTLYDGTQGLRQTTTAQFPPAPPPPPIAISAVVPIDRPTSFVAGTTEALFPIGAFTSTVAFTLTGVIGGLGGLGNLFSAGPAFDLSAVISSTGQAAQIASGAAITLTIPIGAAIGSASPGIGGIGLWRLDPLGWSQLGITSTLDLENEQLTSRIDHLSRFAVLAHGGRLYMPALYRSQ